MLLQNKYPLQKKLDAIFEKIKDSLISKYGNNNLIVRYMHWEGKQTFVESIFEIVKREKVNEEFSDYSINIIIDLKTVTAFNDWVLCTGDFSAGPKVLLEMKPVFISLNSVDESSFDKITDFISESEKLLNKSLNNDLEFT